MKKCSTCHKIKAFTEYYRESRAKDGYRARCKQCHKPSNYIKINDKVCTKCRKKKDIEEYNIDTLSRDGCRPLCKSCESIRHKEYVGKLKRRKLIEAPLEKKCCTCKKTKDINKFYKSTARVDGHTENCIKCRRSLHKQRVIKNPNLYKEGWKRAKKRILSDPKKLEAYKDKNRQYYINNKSKCYSSSRRWVQDNPERVRKYSRKYYNTPKGKQLEKSKRANRRNAGRITPAIVSKLEIQNIGKFGNLTCEYCGVIIKDRKYHLEHKIPVSRNGKTVINNLCISCPTCNLSKGKLTDVEYKIKLSKITKGAKVA